MTLVVGYDRHPASRVALAFARDLAGSLHTQLHVVHVVDLNDSPVDTDSADWAEKTERQLEAEHRQVREAMADTPVPWTYHAMQGDAVSTLLAAASTHAASMIVVGRPEQGIGAVLGHIMTGAVARSLIKRSPLPVLVVPDSLESAR